MARHSIFYNKEYAVYGKSQIDITDKQASYNYYMDKAFLETNKMFKWNGLPDNIPQDYLELMIQSNGYVILAYINDNEITRNKDRYKEGIYAFACGLGGELDEFFQPTEAIIVSAPMGLSINRKIGIDCAIIRNDTLKFGLTPINSRYASMMLENDITLRTYDINCRIPFIMNAHNDKQYESAKALINDVKSGNIGIIKDDSLEEESPFTTAPYQSQTNSMKDLIEYHQYLLANWRHDRGINSNPNNKRESLSDDEVGVNEGDLLITPDNMYKTRIMDIDKANKILNLKLECEKSSVWEIVEKKEEAKLEALENEADKKDSIEDDNPKENNEEVEVNEEIKA